MSDALIVTRRAALSVMLGLPLGGQAWSQDALPKVVVAKSPACGCCALWVTHMRDAGFLVDVIETRDVDRLRERMGVPRALASCHTAEVGGYVVEGHVPAGAVKRLLMERPQARGLAVPGMPQGSPGMEQGRPPETYDVVLFGTSGQRPFARYRGSQPI